MVAVGPMARPEVLIADDDAISRELLQLYLESVGCGVLAAGSGSDALRACQANGGRIGLGILDACMPGPAPQQLYELFRSVCPSVPVLFCSALPAEDPMLRFIGEHRLPLLRKPVDHTAFFPVVAEALRGANTEASAAIVPCVELPPACQKCGAQQALPLRSTQPGAGRQCGRCGAELGGRDRRVPTAERVEVLIADDESVHRRILEFYLGSFGCRVQAAKSGHEVLDACRAGAEGIKLAVLDVRMPGPSPIWLYERMREIRPELSVLFCSGGRPDDPEICSLREHGVRVLPKPFRRSDLQRAIEAVLKR